MSSQIEVRTRYAEEDTQFLSDYCEVQVFVNGQLQATYGDAYHERGRERALGFVDGVNALLGADNVAVTHTRVADYPI